ncbi:hypothetical protein [Aquisalimonas sp.]|uniref:hypothetical protein n=1 Tax=Aquisalimonas sp. TaxID=1872621 RepID=UPI0025BF7663|nr:hypothetical protein [Aquisalimonas sp.]
MDRAEIIQRGADQEAERIRFIEQNRGQEAAEAFARQTRALYRRAVVNRSAPAGDQLIRLRLLGSYCYLKRYLHRKAGQSLD